MSNSRSAPVADIANVRVALQHAQPVPSVYERISTVCKWNQLEWRPEHNASPTKLEVSTIVAGLLLLQADQLRAFVDETVDILGVSRVTVYSRVQKHKAEMNKHTENTSTQRKII